MKFRDLSENPAEMFAMYNSFHACVEESLELYIISKIPKGRMLKKRIVQFFTKFGFKSVTERFIIYVKL